MNSPPEALSPSPSTPSSGSPSPDETSLPPISTAFAGGATTTHPHSPQALVSVSPQQAKRRLPYSSSSVFAGREGRENKSRRRDRDRDGDERARKCGAAWESQRGEVPVLGHGGAPRAREELVDLSMVEYVRDAYGDPFDDTILKERNKDA